MRRNDQNWNDGGFGSRDLRDDNPEAIESNIRRTRVEMDETLDELASRLEPGRLVGDVWHAIRGRAGGAGDMAASFASNAARSTGSTILHQAARHPLPSALIGAGLVWMITEQARSGRSGQHRERYSGAYEPPYGPQYGPRDVDAQRAAYEARQRASYEPRYRYPGESSPAHYQGVQEHDEGHRRGGIGRQVAQRASHVGEQISSRASNVAERAAHVAGDSMHRVSSTARGMGDRAGENMSAVSRRVSRTANSAAHNIAENTSHAYERYPLGVALAAMGAGLLAGMAAPNTRRENRWMGETSRRLRRDAIGTAREQAAGAIEAGAERVAHAAESATERAEKAVRGKEKESSSGQSSPGSSGLGQEHTESGSGRHEPVQSSGQRSSGYGGQIEPRH